MKVYIDPLKFIERYFKKPRYRIFTKDFAPGVIPIFENPAKLARCTNPYTYIEDKKNNKISLIVKMNKN